MNVAIEHLRNSGFEVLPRMSLGCLLEHRNINVLGRYSFALPEAVTQDEFRPRPTQRKRCWSELN